MCVLRQLVITMINQYSKLSSACKSLCLCRQPTKIILVFQLFLERLRIIVQHFVHQSKTIPSKFPLRWGNRASQQLLQIFSKYLHELILSKEPLNEAIHFLLTLLISIRNAAAGALSTEVVYRQNKQNQFASHLMEDVVWFDEDSFDGVCKCYGIELIKLAGFSFFCIAIAGSYSVIVKILIAFFSEMNSDPVSTSELAGFLISLSTDCKLHNKTKRLRLCKLRQSF